MKTISRYIMTLALLLTAATGAWAQGEQSESFTTNNYDYVYTGNNFKITVDDSGDSDGFILSEIKYATIEALNGETITKVEFTKGGYDDINAFSCEVGTTNISGDVATVSGVNQTSLTVSATGPLQIKAVKVYFITAPAEPDVEVTTNAASEGATFTEAWFAMPAFDATADYELVRDMSVQMTAQVGDGTQEQPRYRVKKDGNNKFIPADMEITAVPALFTVNDAIEQKALTQTQDYIVQIYAIDAEGKPTGDPMTLATFTFEPGIYAVKAVAATNEYYDGETALSNTFKLYEGFPVVVPATEGEVGETVDLGTLSFYTEEFNLKLDPANQANLYTLTAIDGSTVTATKVDVVPAGMPFFVLNEENVDQTVTLIPADNNEVATETPKPIAEFLGTTTDLTFTQDDMDGDYNYYVLYKGAFVWVKDPGTLKAGKCYLRVLKSQPTTSRRIVFDGATAVYDLNDKSEMINDNYYDLNGRKVNKPTKKGVYIMNGRKVVVK